MQLTQFTDYSLRALIYLALDKNELCKISDIAKSYRISKNHLVKVINRLGQLGYIKTIRGNSGGIKLYKDPTEINIGEVVRKVEPNFFIVECFDSNKNACTITSACKLRHVLHKAKNSFIAVLDEYTLADMVANKNELTLLFEK